MNNLHLIQTNQPSKIHLAYNKLYYLSVQPFIQLDTKNYKSFNLYVTSDKLIKENEYNVPSDFNNISDISKTSKEDLFTVNEKGNGYRKIILTNDVNLIKNGVEPIDDEFLQWFIKNPGCKSVEVEDYGQLHNFRYLLLTPKKEFKPKPISFEPFNKQRYDAVLTTGQQIMNELQQSVAEEKTLDIIAENICVCNTIDCVHYKMFKKALNGNQKEVIMMQK